MTNERWGRFRFQLVGQLLAAPPIEHEELQLVGKASLRQSLDFCQSIKISDTFSYQTVRRYRQGKGLTRTKRKRGFLRKGATDSLHALEKKEICSYEATHVGGLWHFALRHAKRPVLTQSGEWARPIPTRAMVFYCDDL